MPDNCVVKSWISFHSKYGISILWGSGNLHKEVLFSLDFNEMCCLYFQISSVTPLHLSSPNCSYIPSGKALPQYNYTVASYDQGNVQEDIRDSGLFCTVGCLKNLRPFLSFFTISLFLYFSCLWDFYGHPSFYSKFRKKYNTLLRIIQQTWQKHN